MGSGSIDRCGEPLLFPFDIPVKRISDQCQALHLVRSMISPYCGFELAWSVPDARWHASDVYICFGS